MGNEVAGANHKKRERYALAFDRIDAAMKAGFPIEAIMIAESVILDRIQSHLRDRLAAGYEIKTAAVAKALTDVGTNGHASTGNFVKELRRHFDDLGERKFAGLPNAIENWTKTRNRAAHAFVKTNPITRSYPESHEEFMGMLISCAEEGLRLAKLVKGWTSRRGAKSVGQPPGGAAE